MDSYLFFYLFYNIHNGRFLDSLKYKWICQKYIYIDTYYCSGKIDNIIFNPPSILEFTKNAEYFFESLGFFKELNLFEPQYFHYQGESLYSQKLDFICMAYAKKRLNEVFKVDDSYEKLFAVVASEYAEHTKGNKINRIERGRQKPESRMKLNFGSTNNRLGFFSNAILKSIQDKYIFEAHCFKNHNEIYEYFLHQHWKENSIIPYELLIAKKIVDSHIITTANFHEIKKNGFEINREISSLIKKLKKLKKNEK
jgi:hypothetical protein